MLEVLSKNSKMKIENKYYIYSVLLPCKLEYMLDTMMKKNTHGSNDYRMRWILKQYADSNIQLIFPDIIRFLI